MKIQAITSAMSAYCCQPVNKVEFARQKSPQVENTTPVNEADSFVQNDMSTMEQKYDLACRIAAYYKTQYENLLENGSCIA